MKLTLTGRHFEITPHLKSHVEEKSKKLERFNHHLLEGEIVLFKDHFSDVAEGKIHLRHVVIAAKGSGPDMYAAVSELIDKLVVQLKRHDGRLRDQKRTSSSVEPKPPDGD